MAKEQATTEPKTDAEVEAFVHEHLKDVYHEVGRIASVWAMLEFRMDQFIWHLTGIEQTLGACLTTQLHGATPRLRTLKSILEFRGSSPNVITKLNRFSADIVEPQEERNRAVHDPWFVSLSGATSQIRKATIRNKVVYEPIPRTADDLKGVYRGSLAILKRFIALRDEILSEPLQTLRGRQRKKLWRAGLRAGLLLDQDKSP